MFRTDSFLPFTHQIRGWHPYPLGGIPDPAFTAAMSAWLDDKWYFCLCFKWLRKVVGFCSNQKETVRVLVKETFKSQWLAYEKLSIISPVQMLRLRNLVSSLLMAGRLYLMIAGRDADSSSSSSGRNWLQLVFPERFCQVFDRLRSYSLYKSFLVCHPKCTCFSRRASILQRPSLNKANSAIIIWRWASLTAPCNRMLEGLGAGEAFVIMSWLYLMSN